MKYLNNILEGDHGRLKRIFGPKGAFKNRTSAYRMLKGMEAMRSLWKGRGAMFAYGQPNPDAVIVTPSSTVRQMVSASRLAVAFKAGPGWFWVQV